VGNDSDYSLMCATLDQKEVLYEKKKRKREDKRKTDITGNNLQKSNNNIEE
jgi:hypothetical protein